MGGGGGGGSFTNHSAADLAKLVRDAEDKTTVAAFEVELASELADLLGDYNSRDHQTVRERLDEIKAVLEDSVDGTLDQLFGGSVAKHTYVDGLSDIDSLIIVNETSLENHAPKAILDHIMEVLDERLGGTVSVSHGRMAVTITYEDNMQIQLLPAIRTAEETLHVPSSRRNNEWSHIDPSAFTKALTNRNDECAGKLVPTIKLAKAINSTFPEAAQLSGYHVESLAIAAFSNYDGTKTTCAMLPILFERAKDLVLSPIRDRTGQSVHVDEYLGEEGSNARLAAAHILGRTAKRMRNATASGSRAQWRSLFDVDD